MIIRVFITEQLNKDPKELLGDDAWAVLIEVKEVYEKERAECTGVIEGLKYFNDVIMNAFESYSCHKCGSGLIMPPARNV